MSGLMTPSLRLSSRIVRGTPPKYANASSCSLHQISVDDFQTVLRNAWRLLPERHHEQPRPAILAGARIARQRAFAVVDLRFLAGLRFKTTTDLRLVAAQFAGEPLDGIVGAA